MKGNIAGEGLGVLVLELVIIRALKAEVEVRFHSPCRAPFAIRLRPSFALEGHVLSLSTPQAASHNSDEEVVGLPALVLGQESLRSSSVHTSL